MKTIPSLLLALAITLPVVAQEEAVVDAVVEDNPTAARAARAAQRKLEAERRARESLEGKPRVYGGFLSDFRKSERKSRFLSLRQPADPKNDYKNVLLDERTARPKGFVLFSIGF